MKSGNLRAFSEVANGAGRLAFGAACSLMGLAFLSFAGKIRAKAKLGSLYFANSGRRSLCLLCHNRSILLARIYLLQPDTAVSMEKYWLPGDPPV